MSEEKRTGDVATTDDNSQQQTPDEVELDEAEKGEPTDDQEPSDTLDFDDLLGGTSKKNKETRGGLSRKEYRKLKEQGDDEEENYDDIYEDDEKYQTLEKEVKDMKNLLKKRDSEYEIKEAQLMIEKTLAAKELSVPEFNAHYSNSFKKRQQELLDKGLSLKDATAYAMDLVTNDLTIKKKVQEAEERAKGRRNASLSAVSKTNSPAAPFRKLKKEEYANMFDNLVKQYKKPGVSEREATQQAKDHYQKYNEHWESRGEKAFQ